MRFFDVSQLHAKDFQMMAELLRAEADEEKISAACRKVMEQIHQAKRFVHYQDDDYQVHEIGNLQITFDRTVNAYYFYLQPKNEIVHASTSTEVFEAEGFHMVNIDYNVNGKAYGIELLAL